MENMNYIQWRMRNVSMLFGKQQINFKYAASELSEDDFCNHLLQDVVK